MPVPAVAADAVPPSHVFPPELWQGETGEFLRKAGFSPDDPINVLAKQTPLEQVLHNDLAVMEQALGAANTVSPSKIGPWHLLPLELWRSKYGDFLVNRLDLSPYRPWNTIFLPIDEMGAEDLGLPILPHSAGWRLDDEIDHAMEEIVRIFSGKGDAISGALGLLLKAIKQNNPFLLPPDPRNFSENVRIARSDVRALALLTAGKDLTTKVIERSQRTFLADPAAQLLA